MGQFKHHSAFPKERLAQTYLLPNVCFSCRKSFKKPVSERPRACPQCGHPMTALNRKFRPPRQSDATQWEKVRLLVENGFLFQSVYERRGAGAYLVPYPKTLEEAREFVAKFKCCVRGAPNLAE